MDETRYRAFISYSQKDKVWGARLHRWLENYRVPIDLQGNDNPRRRLGRFFRDDDEMPATADIATRLMHSLDQSESLIVICSRHSARSKWVAAEVQYFRKIGRGQNIFAFIVDGEPNSGNPDTECLPAVLQATAPASDAYTLPLEPMGVDIRRDGRARACARLAAGLLDVDFDDLWQRDRRRIASRQRRWIGGLGTASVAFAALSVIAVRFALSARKNSTKAAAARANLLADTSTRFLADGNIGEALGYAAAALEIAQSNSADATARAEYAARSALIAHHTAQIRLAVTYRGHDGRVTDVATSADGQLQATAGDDGVARIYDRTSGALVKKVSHESAIVAIFFFDNDRYLLSAAKDGELKATSIAEAIETLKASLGARCLNMQPTPAGDAVLAWGLSGKVALWRPAEDKLNQIQIDGSLPTLNAEFLPQDPDLVFLDHSLCGTLISLRGQKQLRRFTGAPVGRELHQGLVSFASNDQLEVVELRSGHIVCKIETKSVECSVLDTRANRLVVLTRGTRLVEFWSLDHPTKLASHELKRGGKGLTKALASNRLVVWDSSGASVFQLDDGQVLFEINAKFDVFNLDVSDETGRLLLRSADGRVGIWSLIDGVELKSIEGQAAIRDAKFSESGRTVWIGRESGELQLVALDENGFDGRFFHGDAILGWRTCQAASEFLTWSADGTAKLWSWLPKPIGYLVDHTRLRATTIAVNPEANILYAAHGNTVAALRLDDGEPLAQTTIENQIFDLILSNNGEGALVSNARGLCAWSVDGTAGAWRETDSSNQTLAFGPSSFALFDKDAGTASSVDSSRPADGFNEVAKDVEDVSVVGEISALVVCRSNGEMDIYSRGIQNAPTTFPLDQSPISCTGSQNRNRIAVVAGDGAITIFDLDDTLLTTLAIWRPPVTIPIDQVTRSNRVQIDHDLIFAGRDGKLIWLDVDNHRVIRDETSTNAFRVIRLSDDLQTLVALGKGKTSALLFDRADNRPLRLEHRSNVLGTKFLARNKIATWSADRMLKVWRTNGDLELELPHFGIVQGVTATLGGDFLVSWTDNKDLTGWDLETGARLFETKLKAAVREVRFLKSPTRMIVLFYQLGPMLLPHVPREHLQAVMSDLVAVQRPFSQSEQSGFAPVAERGSASFLGVRRGLTSRVTGPEFLTGWGGTLELALLRDGGLLLVSDTPLTELLQLVEYNEFDQILSLYAKDGSAATVDQLLTPMFLDAIRSQNSVIVYTLFPNHEPVGYRVPLMKQ
jgi:WD40 repeat protein